MEKQNPNPRRFGSRGEYLVAFQVLLMTAFVLIPVRSILPDEAKFVAGRWALLGLCWAASAFFGIGGFLALRKYLTPLPYPVDENRLIDTGVYRLVRHPLYTAIMLAFTGWTLFSGSLTHLAMTIVAFVFFSHKASKEETWLTQLHPEYPDYAARTGRFVPRLKKKRPGQAHSSGTTPPRVSKKERF
jgi:protein-S-isoprenylcysteine O-methyltransferase Ste14